MSEVVQESRESWIPVLRAHLPQPDAALELSDDELLAQVVAVEAVGRAVDALRAMLAGEVAERSRRELGSERLTVRRGCRTAVELIQRLTGASAVAVARRIRLGRAVRPERSLVGELLPAPFRHVARGLSDAVIGIDSALAVVDTLAAVRRVAGAEDVAVAEEHLVVAARAESADGVAPTDADTVRLQATAWAAALDPDGAPPDERDEERRGIRLLTPRHGLVPIRGLLLPEVAGAFQRYADACANPASSDPTAAIPADPASSTVGSGRADDGPSAVPPGPSTTDGGPAPEGALVDQRSKAQRMHDTLATIVGAAARAADAPSIAGNPATLVVAVRADDLTSGRGVADSDAVAAPISLRAANQIGCAGAVQTVVLGAEGRIVGLGARERCFTGNQRRAIALRDGGCVIPGCHVPAGWCEVHHVVPHAHDPGGTHTDNGVLLCWFHHRSLETSGWQIRMRRGVPEIRSPLWLDPSGTWRRALGSPTRMADLIERGRADGGV